MFILIILIDYFYKNKFYKVVIGYTDTDSDELEHYLSSIYGEGNGEYIMTPRAAERARKASMSTYWVGKDVDIKLIRQTMGQFDFCREEPDCGHLTIGEIKFYTCLSYTYKPINKQKERDDKIRHEQENKKERAERHKKEQELRKKIEKDL